MNIKEFLDICIKNELPADFEIKFSVGMALYDLDEYIIGKGNRRIIFRESEEREGK